MKVVMPKVEESPTELKTRRLYLAKFNSRNVVETVYYDGSEVITITPEGNMETVSYDFFEQGYTIIRPYNPGESITITA
jgi:hypothetical protein